MKIKEIRISHGFLYREVNFKSSINCIYSKKNSTGKTTFIRCLLYALGYNIPSTRGLDFSRMEFEISVESQGILYEIKRRNTILVVDDGINEIEYILPNEFNRYMVRITGIDNLGIVENLLGVFYADQEKGWTMLNRGNAISKIHFSVDELVGGLAGRDWTLEKLNIDKLKRQIKEYKVMLAVSELSNDENYDLNEVEEFSSKDIYDETLLKELSLLKAEENSLKNDINDIKMLIKNNNMFVDYIDKLGLSIEYNGEIIPIIKENLLGYNDIALLLKHRKNIFLGELADIKRKIANIEVILKKEESLIDSKSVIDEFGSRLKKISFNPNSIERIIKKLEDEKGNYRNLYYEKIRENNTVAIKMYSWIKKYSDEFQISSEYIPNDPRCLFTDDLKSLSGTILHQMIFFYKLSYIRAVREYTGVCLPIILDSPSGREVRPETVNNLLNILPRDFSQHQIIIASIYDFGFEDANIIEFKEQLFE